MNDDSSADRPETETEIGQARRRFFDAARALAIAVQDDNVPDAQGHEITSEFIKAYNVLDRIGKDTAFGEEGSDIACEEASPV